MQYYTPIPGGGYHYEFPLDIQMKDYYPNFPEGEYKMAILAYIGGGVHVITNGIFEDSLTYFNISDICPTCPDVYEGNDNDDDGLNELFDNCPNTYNPDQLDSDDDGIDDSCDNNDIDNDGVLDSIDHCPNEFGNVSNFGCAGNPDFIIDTTVGMQYSSSNSQNGSIKNVEDGVLRPVIYRYGGNISIYDLTMKNIGDGYSGSYQGPYIHFYLSNDQNLSSDDFHFGARTLNIGSSEPGGSVAGDVSLEGADIGNNKPYGDYYLIIKIDPNNDLQNSEINRSNNTIYLPVKYTGTIPSGKLFLKINYNEVMEISTYSEISKLSITDLKSRKIIFDNTYLPNSTIETLLLPGFYAIYLNDVYIKKIKVLPRL